MVVIAGTGMLGRAFCELLEAQGYEFRTTTRTELDLGDPASIERWEPPAGAVVVNCAAFTDVDGAEARPDMADQVNGYGVGALAGRCLAAGATLVHFSTDYVFDGSATDPYPVDHPIAPLNAYGRSKALGERLIHRSGCPNLIIRTSWLYAPWGKNFVRTIAQRLLAGGALRVVNDQHGRPTSAQHLARCTLRLIEGGARGTFHVTDGGQCTWFRFACEMARLLGREGAVEPCTTGEFPRPARRPGYSVLDIGQTERVLDPMPHWTENLRLVIEQLRATGEL